MGPVFLQFGFFTPWHDGWMHFYSRMLCLRPPTEVFSKDSSCNACKYSLVIPLVVSKYSPNIAEIFL